MGRHAAGTKTLSLGGMRLVAVLDEARGIPVGSAIEYMDPATLRRALEGRQNFS